jgi:hypothetical protein
VENRLQVEGQRIPNLTHADVPVSNDEDAATVLSLVRGGRGQQQQQRGWQPHACGTVLSASLVLWWHAH